MNKNPDKPKDMEKIMSNLFNKNQKHKRIAKEVSEMLDRPRYRGVIKIHKGFYPTKITNQDENHL